jgi:hypothetical protein
VELHDEQQTRVVERLQAANGAPVSFEELRAMGVENPALLCYELEAIGLPVERPREPGTGVRALSVRLEPSSTPQDQEHVDRSEEQLRALVSERLATSTALRPAKWERTRSWSRPAVLVGFRVSRPLVAVAAALTFVVAVGIGLALSDHGGHTASGLSAQAHASRTSTGGSRAVTGGPRAGTGKSVAPRRPDRGSKQSGAQRKPVPVSTGAAAAFEAEGHQLLATGRYAAAIGDLRSAVQASGGSLQRCAEPTSEACLTYAYALYDLGRALQLDGEPAAAIQILSERLRIDNQREAVQQELDIARSARA